MKKFLVLFVITFAFSINITAQTKEANPADVASIDAIIKAVYEVISGDAGKARDWDRFRTLFHKDAHLIPSDKNPQTGIVSATALTPEDYLKQAEPFFLNNGFFEKEIANRKEIYGNIAHVFSTYESFRKSDEKKPFMRGINSFQLLNDGKRWWIVNIFWLSETPENLIPKKYLKSKN